MSESINIIPSGFAPKWYKSSYPAYGNKSQAGDMRNIDLTDPNSMTQGKGVAALTAGTQAGAVTTLIKGIQKVPTSSNVAYAVGGAKLYQLSATAVTNTGSFPHAIDKATVTGEDGEDVMYYNGFLFYSYNHSGSAGDVGRFDLSSTFDDDYMSTVPTGAAALQSAPHQMAFGNDRLYIANGKYVAQLDNTTFTADSLTLYTGSVVQSIVWNDDRLYIAVNNPNVLGANHNASAIYKWTGYDDNWDGDPIEVNGRIGALYVKNGVTYIWYESLEAGVSKPVFGYVGGGRIVPLATFTGTMPLYYQVSEMNDYIIWLSDNRIYAYGSVSEEATKLFQIMSTTRATGGGLGTPFGKIIAASNATTNYNLDVESGYATDAYWYSLMFPVSTNQNIFQLENIVVWVENMSTGAKLDTTLRYDAGKSSLALDQIAYSASTTPTRIIIGKQNLPRVEDFRLEFSYSNGSTSNPVKVKRIEVLGSYVQNK